MSTYETFEAYDRPIASPAFTALHRVASSYWATFVARLAERRTHRILSGLDPKVLEDIGVPHTNASPSASKLDRYPHIIDLNNWRT